MLSITLLPAALIPMLLLVSIFGYILRPSLSSFRPSILSLSLFHTCTDGCNNKEEKAAQLEISMSCSVIK